MFHKGRDFNFTHNNTQHLEDCAAHNGGTQVVIKLVSDWLSPYSSTKVAETLYGRKRTS